MPEINCLLTEHNVEYMRYLRWIEKEKNYIKKLYISKQYKDLKNYEINTLKDFKTCVVMSEFDKSILEAYTTNTTFKVIPNGTDTDYFKPIKSTLARNSLIWVGGMFQWPNIDAVEYFVNEIFPLIITENPDVIFNVVGADPIKILYKSKYSNNIRVHGFVDDIRPLVAASNIYVAPIRIGSGTKLKILDAMSMGKCIVTTSVGLEGIDANIGSDIFVCDTQAEFARVVLKLLSDTNLVMKTGENARRFIVNKYSWKKIFEEMDSLYE
jgi:glycosyltransferase involved in cell wall biosynthesis